MNTLLTNMKTALLGDSTLGAYLDDAIEIGQWNPEALPDFDKYCVVLSPVPGVEEKPAGVLGIEKTFNVDIVCLVRNYGLPAALTGTTAPDGVGVIKLAEDVRNCLRENSLSSYVIADSMAVSAASMIDRAIDQSEHVLKTEFGYLARRRVQIHN